MFLCKMSKRYRLTNFSRCTDTLVARELRIISLCGLGYMIGECDRDVIGMEFPGWQINCIELVSCDT